MCAQKKKTPAFKGSVSSGGEKMRRTRVAFYVAYLIVPQVSDPSTGNLAVFSDFSGWPHFTSFCRSTVLV